MVNLLHLFLVRVVDVIGHRAHLPEDCVRALPLGKQLAVGGGKEKQDPLAGLKLMVPGLLVIPCLLDLPGLA